MEILRNRVVLFVANVSLKISLAQEYREEQREKGHIKDLYCLSCSDITQNIEVRYCDDYLEVMDKAIQLYKEYYGEG